MKLNWDTSFPAFFQLWESKLLQSKAVDGNQADQDRLYALYQQQQQAKPTPTKTVTAIPAAVAASSQKPVMQAGKSPPFQGEMMEWYRVHQTV